MAGFKLLSNCCNSNVESRKDMNSNCFFKCMNCSNKCEVEFRSVSSDES